MDVEIPKIEWDDVGPGWIPSIVQSGKHIKPIIKCKCNSVCGIGLHHVHADGRVTASFFHSTADWEHKGKKYKGDPKGCGWHVFLKLNDYTYGEFPPEDI